MIPLAARRATNAGTPPEVTIPALNLNSNVMTVVMWIYPFENQTNGVGLLYNTGEVTDRLQYRHQRWLGLQVGWSHRVHYQSSDSQQLEHGGICGDTEQHHVLPV